MRALITGASRGIGLELAKQYLARGDEVIAAVRDVRARELFDATSRVRVLAMDVVSTESVRAARAQCEGVSIDVLINNAGINAAPQHAPGMDIEQTARVLNVNALGPERVYDAFVDLLRQPPFPKRLVNISSESGSLSAFRATPKPDYGMSKAALNSLTRWIASQEPSIVCVAVHPGWVRTDMGGPNAPLNVSGVAVKLIAAIDRLGMEHSGLFLDSSLAPMPW